MLNPTILILGAAHYQVPVIKEAVKQDLYVVTCSYKSGDPGHQYAHKYYQTDISDVDAVCELAQQVNPDYVLGHISETAVRTAAEVNDRLGMPGPSIQVVKLLIEKGRFRNFQKQNGFDYPNFVEMSENELNKKRLGDLHFPLIVKPADACGSRGVRRIPGADEIQDAVRYAMSYSTRKSIIVEEEIAKRGPQVTGDGFMLDGQLQFLCLGDHHFHSNSEFPVAYTTTWPSQITNNEQQQVGSEIERLLFEIGYLSGPFNVDARIGSDGGVYIIEIAPRNGGNYVPQCAFISTGVNLEECLIKHIRGNAPVFTPIKSGYSANYILHSHTKGIFRGLHVSDKLKTYIQYQHMSKKFGDKVNEYRHLGDALGVLIFEFDEQENMRKYMDGIHDHISVDVNM